MSRLPVYKLALSPCCRLELYELPQGENTIPHLRCSECRKVWALRNGKLVPCVSPDEHLKLSGFEVSRLRGQKTQRGG